MKSSASEPGLSETITLEKANHFFSFFGYPSFPASLCMRNLGKGEGHTECTTKILTRTHALPPPIKRFSYDDSDRNKNVQKPIEHHTFWYKKKRDFARTAHFLENFFVLPARTLCDISLSQKLWKLINFWW